MSTSRKRYYAVRRGREGAAIYTSWQECQSQVEGFSNAEYKSFPHYEDAEVYLSHRGDAKSKFYAVKKGRNGPNIYTTWEECRGHVEGYPGAEYQKFSIRKEAEDYIRPIVGTSSQPPNCEIEKSQWMAGLWNGILALFHKIRAHVIN